MSFAIYLLVLPHAVAQARTVHHHTLFTRLRAAGVTPFTSFEDLPAAVSLLIK